MDASRRAFTEGNEENKDSNLGGYRLFLPFLPLVCDRGTSQKIFTEDNKGNKGCNLLPKPSLSSFLLFKKV
jgi:hypothetical protein